MKACPISARVAALRSVSARLGAELPDELCLVILLRWKGMQHRAANIMLTDPELCAALEQLDASGGTWPSTRGCACGLYTTMPDPYDLFEEAHRSPTPEEANPSRLRHHDTFRPTRRMAAHLNCRTLCAQGGYRDPAIVGLYDQFGQRWEIRQECGLLSLWWRLWHVTRNPPLFFSLEDFARQLANFRRREYSLAEYLKRASTGRIVSEYRDLSGSHPPPDDGSTWDIMDGYRKTLIRGILACNWESHRVQQYVPQDPSSPPA